MSCQAEWGSVVANSYGGFIFHEKLGSPRVHNIVRPEFTISANIEKSKWPFFILIYIHILFVISWTDLRRCTLNLFSSLTNGNLGNPLQCTNSLDGSKESLAIWFLERRQQYKILRSNFDIQIATMSHHVQFQFVWSLFQCGAYGSFFFCSPKRTFKDLKLLIKYRDIPGLPASLLAIVQHWLLV